MNTTPGEHEHRRTDLGAYLIGSLAPPERATIERHLGGCPDCRAELATLAPLPGLLARLAPDEARDQALTPDPQLLARTLHAVRDRQRSQQRRLVRWRLATVAAGIVAIAVVALPPLVGSAPSGSPLVSAAGVTATGTGGLSARPWGTAVVLTVTGLPAATGYVAYAMGRDGRGEIAATWGVTPDGHAAVTGATAIPRADLAAVQIRTTDGRTLLTLSG